MSFGSSVAIVPAPSLSAAAGIAAREKEDEFLDDT